MSSIIACRLPPPLSSTPSTMRGVLSSEDRPMDWASRRAGSTVSTQTCLPRSAARSPIAAAAVVLPTPPDPQQTMIRVRRSSMMRSISSLGLVTLCFLPPGAWASSRGPLITQLFGQPVQSGQVDSLGDHGQLVDGLADRLEFGPLAVLQLDVPGVLGELAGQRHRELVGGV